MSVLVLAALSDPAITAVAIVGLLLGVALMARGIRADVAPATGHAAAPPDGPEAGPQSADPLPEPEGTADPLPEAAPPEAEEAPARPERIRLRGGPSMFDSPAAAPAEEPPAAAEDPPAAAVEEPAEEEPASSQRIKLTGGPSIFERLAATSAEEPPAAPAEAAPAEEKPARPARIKLTGGPSIFERMAGSAPETPPPPAQRAPLEQEPETPPEPDGPVLPPASEFRQGPIRLRDRFEQGG